VTRAEAAKAAARPATRAKGSWRCGGLCLLVLLGGLRASAQQTTRLAILQAEDRRAASPRDLAILRYGARSSDDQTARAAIRALGRLERPLLIGDIIPALRHRLPEVRIEAANAIGQAAAGWTADRAPAASAVDTAVAPLAARLKVESEPDVRAAICETLGRIPYVTAAQAEAAEGLLVESGGRADSIGDRLGVAKGLEALVRTQRKLRTPGDAAIALLRRLATPTGVDAAVGARVRRLSLEALISGGAVDVTVLGAAAHDPDPQVRRIAMRAATAEAAPTVGASEAHAVLTAGRVDESAPVRFEALRGLRARHDPDSCAAATAAAADPDVHVAVFAVDQLAACGAAQDAAAMLEQLVTDGSAAASPRGWHRAAHGIVALASASPELAAKSLGQFSASPVWQLRMYAARAAALVSNRAALEAFAKDDDDNVREAAVEGLRKVAGHEADGIYIAGLARSGNQIVRASALALDGSPNPDAAIPALKAAWQRLVAEGRDNSHDARDAIAKSLSNLSRLAGPDARDGRARSRAGLSEADADDLRRLASPKARVTIRSVGTFELVLFTAQAPATVLRFARLAESGYYNGLTFHRVVPNFVIQGGSPGANEYIGDASFMRDEVGTWPHVRGAVGISTRGHDTGDAQIFVDLVDNPRLDHQYTVFAQVLNGIDVVDRVLEGDVIERIEIVP